MSNVLWMNHLKRSERRPLGFDASRTRSPRGARCGAGSCSFLLLSHHLRWPPSTPFEAEADLRLLHALPAGRRGVVPRRGGRWSRSLLSNHLQDLPAPPSKPRRIYAYSTRCPLIAAARQQPIERAVASSCCSNLTSPFFWAYWSVKRPALVPAARQGRVKTQWQAGQAIEVRVGRLEAVKGRWQMSHGQGNCASQSRQL